MIQKKKNLQEVLIFFYSLSQIYTAVAGRRPAHHVDFPFNVGQMFWGFGWPEGLLPRPKKSPVCLNNDL